MVVHEAQVSYDVITDIGAQTTGNNIDVYLAPIIEVLKIMWEKRVEVFDAYRQELFTLRVILLWTINNFLAHDNLSAYSVKGHKTCPICEEDIFSIQLKHGRKTVYLGTQKFLPTLHHRRLRKAFKIYRRRKNSKSFEW